VKKEYIILFLVFVLDIISKEFVKIYNIFTKGHVLDITYSINKGSLFSLFSSGTYVNFIFILLSFFALGFLYYVYIKEKKYEIQLALICSGILGNSYIALCDLKFVLFSSSPK